MNAPPILVSYNNNLKKYLSVLPENYVTQHGENISNLHAKGYPPIVSATNISALFGYNIIQYFSRSNRPQRYHIPPKIS